MWRVYWCSDFFNLVFTWPGYENQIKKKGGGTRVAGSFEQFRGMTLQHPATRPGGAESHRQLASMHEFQTRRIWLGFR